MLDLTRSPHGPHGPPVAHMQRTQPAQGGFSLMGGLATTREAAPGTDWEGGSAGSGWSLLDAPCVATCCVVVRPAEAVDRWLYTDYRDWRRGNTAVPWKLRGVFFMDGSASGAAQKMQGCYVLDGASWTPATTRRGPRMRIYRSRPLTATYPASLRGLLRYALQSSLCCASVEFRWESDELLRARAVPSLFCGAIPCLGGAYDIVAADGLGDKDAPEGGVVWQVVRPGTMLLDQQESGAAGLSRFPHIQKELQGASVGDFMLRKIVAANGERVASQWPYYADAATESHLVRACCGCPCRGQDDGDPEADEEY